MNTEALKKAMRPTNHRGSIRILISPETLSQLYQYFKLIKENINQDAPDSQYVVPGQKLQQALERFAMDADGKVNFQRIMDMTMGDFIVCLVRTTFTDHFSDSHWNETEHQLLARLVRVIEGVKLLTRRTNHPAAEDILTHEFPSFDAIILNGPLIPPIKRKFTYYKKCLRERLLPALQAFNAKYPQGFVFTLTNEIFPAHGDLASTEAKEFVLALRSLIAESPELIHLKGIVLGHSHSPETISILPGATRIPIICTKKHIEPSQSFNDSLADFFENHTGEKNDLAHFGRYPIVAALPGHALMPPGFELNQKINNRQQTAISGYTTLLSAVTQTPGQLIEDKTGQIHYERADGSWIRALNENRNPVKTIRIVSRDVNEIITPSHNNPMNNPACSLYQAAYALIHAEDFHDNQVKQAHLCEVYSQMKNSSLEAEKAFATSIASLMPDNMIARYRRNHPVVQLSHQLLKELRTQQTKFLSEKNTLGRYLTQMIQRGQTVSVGEFHSHLENIRCHLENREWISLFGRHRLRELIEKYCGLCATIKHQTTGERPAWQLKELQPSF